jgi:hypothetical protein
MFMMYLKLGTVVDVLLPLKDSETLASPDYLFRFVQRTTNDEIAFVKTSAQDTSAYPDRYRKFSFDVDQLFCGMIGEYYYYVYEQMSSSNLDYTAAGSLLTFGVASLVEADGDTYEVTHYNTDNTFITR